MPANVEEFAEATTRAQVDNFIASGVPASGVSCHHHRAARRRRRPRRPGGSPFTTWLTASRARLPVGARCAGAATVSSIAATVATQTPIHAPEGTWSGARLPRRLEAIETVSLGHMDAAGRRELRCVKIMSSP
jgi:hypothetical protein